MDQIGHALAAFCLVANLATAALFAGAWLVDHALARRVSASLRILLYVPVGLRVLLPFSWSVSIPHVSTAATILPLDALSASAASLGDRTPLGYASIPIVYLAVAAALALRAIGARRALSRATSDAVSITVAGVTVPAGRHPVLGPMVVGVTRPRIILPAALLDGSSETALACVLKHETAHVRRRDPLVSAFMDLLLIAFWAIAPLWFCARRIRHLMELACDESALSGSDASERRRYGHVLLDIAEQWSVGAVVSGSLQFGSRLRSRVESIAVQRHWSRPLQVGVATIAALGFAACSSTLPDSVPRPTGKAGSAATAGTLDEYGYEFEMDAMSIDAGTTSAAIAATRDARGRLAPEVIQATVRQGFGSYRRCYEHGLKSMF